MNIKLKSKFLLLLIILSFISCKNDLNNEKSDLINYVTEEDNGFSQTKTINGVKINLTFRPTELMVLQEMSNQENQDPIKKEAAIKKYQKNVYFILSYSKEGKELLSTINESREKFNSIQNTLTFDMVNKISLTNQDKDTIRLIDCNFPRTYGMARSTNLILVFEREKLLLQSKKLIVKIKDIGIGIGDVEFKYKANLINKN